ncbi:MAG TPA: MFS transporter [Dehalococcoidia bacterium]|nr:MFS transporter [Dehalococcoidia bacterium]
MTATTEQPAKTPPAFKLTRGEERRGVVALLANSGLMSFGFYMLFPLISVHYTQDIGMTATVVGVVLAVRQAIQQGLTIVGGALAERIGYRTTIALGMLVRSIGFVLIAFAVDLPLLLAGAVVSAIGGALFEATGLAAMAALTAPAERPRRYALVTTCGSIGSALGPLIGVALLRFDFRYVSLAAAGCFFVAFVLSVVLMPRLPGAGAEAPSFLQTIATVGRDRPFVAFVAFLVGYYVLFTQVFITVPLRAEAVTGSRESVALLYAVNSATLIGLSYVTVRTVSRRFGPVTLLQVGVGLAALGLGSYAVAGGLPVLIVGILGYAFGRMLAEPMIQTVVARAAADQVRAAYFGFAMLALAVGGSGGQLAGGWLYDLGQATGRPALPWLGCALTGAVVVGGLALWRLNPGGRRLAQR